MMDQDILYDRQGFVELDLSESQRKLHNSREFSNSKSLPPVNERLSEDTLEDVHAFSDVVRSSNASRVSIGTDNQVLEPLTECGEEYDNDDDNDDTTDGLLDDIDEEGNSNGGAMTTSIIVTNMENLNLGSNTAAGGARPTTDSSLLEEAPSAPTA